MMVRDSVEGFEWLNSERNARSLDMRYTFQATNSDDLGKSGSAASGKGKKGKVKRSKKSFQTFEGSKAMRDFAAARRAEKEAEDKDELTQQFRKLKVLQREEELNQLKRYRRLQIDPDHHGDEIPWSHTLGTPIKHTYHDRPKSAGIFRSSLDMDEDEVYRNYLKSDKRAAKALGVNVKALQTQKHRLYGSSPQRGKIRPKSAHAFTPKSAEFKNVYRPNKVFERSYSGRCITEKLRNDKSASELIAVEVAKREKWMKERLLACIDEANVYSRTVHEPCLYRIYLQVENEHTRDQEVVKYMESIRYDQIFVEVLNRSYNGLSNAHNKKKSKLLRTNGGAVSSKGDVGMGSRIMSAERFFEDHTRLYQEIKKRRSLMARSRAKAERLHDKRSNPTDLPTQNEKDTLSMRNTKSMIINGTISKEKAYEQMKIILSELVGCKLEIESQCKDIRAKGWNMVGGDDAVNTDDWRYSTRMDDYFRVGDDTW